MSKQSIYTRLLEVANELGMPNPKGKDIAELIGLSAGRIVHLKDPLSTTKLSADPLARLNALGYRTEWINHGELPKRLKDAPKRVEATLGKYQGIADDMEVIGLVFDEEAQELTEKIKALAAKSRKILERFDRRQGTPPTPRKRTGTR